MNWQNKFLIIATLVAIISCKKKNKDFIKLQPNNQVEAIFIDDFSIDAYTVRIDSTLSGNIRNARHLVGVFDDSEIGRTVASTFSELLLPENDLDFNTSVNSFSSAELHLYSDYYYGDNINCQVLVNKVTSSLNLSSDEDFYTLDNRGVGENIGSSSLNPKNSFDTTSIISLSKSFGSSIFNAGSSTNLKNQTNFRSFLKGITLQPQSGNAIVGFVPSKSFVRINFMTDSGITNKDFYLDNNYFNRLTTDEYTGDLSVLKKDKDGIISSETNNKVYAQASTKLNIKISSADLKAFLSKKDISIYRAELEIKVDENPAYPNPGFLYILSTDEKNNQISSSLLFANNKSEFVSLKDEKYTFNITNYCQRNVVDIVDFFDFMVSVSPTGNSVDRLIIEDPSKSIKFKIYYTQL